jgi:hypothetical protein
LVGATGFEPATPSPPGRRNGLYVNDMGWLTSPIFGMNGWGTWLANQNPIKKGDGLWRVKQGITLHKRRFEGFYPFSGVTTRHHC